MRSIIGSAAAILLPLALLPGTLSAQPAPSDRLVSPEVNVRVRRVLDLLPVPPRPAEEEPVDVAVPLEGDEAPSLDKSIPADRLPGEEAPPPPTINGMPTAMMRLYAKVKVLGSGVSEFFYVRQDIWLEFGDGAGSGLEKVLDGANYGPNPIGASVPMVAGANYLLFPVCRGGINWQTRRLAQLPAGTRLGKVTLSCPT